MTERILGWLELLFMLVLCAVTGTPQTAFSSIEHFMLNEHIYEDRCRVMNAFNIESAVYCFESRAAFTNVYNWAGLGFALALVPAVYSSRCLGYSVTNLFCCIALAAGSMVITSDPKDQWLNDRMAYGYALVAFAGPFAIVNALNVICFLGKNKQVLMFLLLTLFSTLQLSPFCWAAFSWQFSNNELTVSDLFSSLLWVPAACMLITLALMPLSTTSQDFDLLKFIAAMKPHFLFRTTGSFYELEETTPLLQPGNSFEIYERNNQSTFRTNFLPELFIPLILAYTFNSMALDLFYLGGEPKAIFHKELAVWAELTGWSPLIAALLSPLVVSYNLKWGLERGATVSYMLSILMTLGQYWSNRASWLLTSLIIGFANSALVFSTIICVVKTVDSRYAIFFTAAFLLVTSIFKSWVLPVIETATEFDTSVLGWNPYVALLLVQSLSSLYALRSLRKQSYKEVRWILEMETENAFA